MSNSALTAYNWLRVYFFAAGFTSNAEFTLPDASYRCDNMSYIPGITSGGCVFFQFQYIWTASSSDPNYGLAAQNVKNGQINLLGHWGWYGHGSGLTRDRNTAHQAAASAIACTGFVKINPADSCDEYAFAATNQSAYWRGGPGPNGTYVGHAPQSAEYPVRLATRRDVRSAADTRWGSVLHQRHLAKVGQAVTRLDVFDNSYTIEERGHGDLDSWDTFNSGTAVVSTSPSRQRVMIVCGTQVGVISVDVKVLNQAPPTVASGWDDVAEVSIHSSWGDFIHILGSGEPDAQFPRLALGAGDFRLRVHLRGRDEASALGPIVPEVDNPVEQHLLTIWPAAPAPPRLLAAQDEFGAAIGRSLPVTC